MICLISACCFRYKALWRHTLHHIYLVLLSFSFHPCCSVTQSCPALCNCGLQHNGFLILHHLLSLLKLMSIELVMTYNHLILCCPLVHFPLTFPSIRVFSNEFVVPIRWPKYWSFSFSISPSIEHSGLISFRTDWFDRLAVRRTLKGLLQYHSSKASILQFSAFFMVQLSHPYVNTGKAIALTRQTFVDKVTSRLLIYCLQLLEGKTCREDQK